MRNFSTERTFHHRAGDEDLAFELTVHVQSGALVTLRATEAADGLRWSYELGAAAHTCNEEESLLGSTAALPAQ